VSTLEEAEAEAWVNKMIEREYKENEIMWSAWKPTVIIIPKKSIYDQRIWGNAYQRKNANKRVEYATEVEVFKHNLS